MKISLYFYKYSSFISCLPFLDQVDYIYLPSDSLSEDIKNLDFNKVFLSFPIISKGRALDIFLNRIGNRKYNFLLKNLGDINLIKAKSKLIHADYSFNIQNRATIDMLKKEAFSSICLSTELDTKEQEKLIEHAHNIGIQAETIVYGRDILMRSEHCYIADKEGYHCNKCLYDNYSLENEEGKIFPLITNPIDCQSALLNFKPIRTEDKNYISRIKRNKSSIIRLNIFDESPKEVLALLEYYRRI